MRVIIRYLTGRRVEALLLSASSRKMRVVVPRLNETLELSLHDSRWNEGTQTVEIEAWMSDGSVAAGRIVEQAAPAKVMTAK
jgi:hypothetical protein